MAISISNKKLFSQPVKEPAIEQTKPETIIVKDDKAIELMAARMAEMSQTIDRLTQQKPRNIVATIKRDDEGKMTSIVITDRV